MVENKNSFKSKRNVVLILFLIVLNWQNLLSQANPIGPNLDNPSIKAFDQFGNQYDPVQLIVLDPGSNYGLGAKAPYTASCTAGYFNVYFGPNSGMDQSNTLHQQRRNVVCQVFYDLSMLINSPLNFNIGSPKVNIYVDDISQYVSSPSSSGVLGIASSYFAEKLNNGVSGVIPGEVWKTIKLGNDSYINTWPIASNNYYHGFVAFNFQNSSIDWDISLSTNTITSTQNDFYTVVLHEATHCLGFSSLISSNGNSVFGINQNYYSFYDLNLKNTNNVSLISNSPSSCNRYGYYFNTSSSFLSPTCPSSTVDVTTCSLSINYSSSYNIPVYTPGCYDNSSLSHFEDLCYAPSSFSLSPPNSNNKYFVMSNSQTLGLAGVKRYLKIEERQVLCDLGYSLNSINNSTVNGAFYNYSVSCPGRDIAGLNDGLNGSVFTYSTSIGIPLTISNINSNDRNATGGYQCLEVLAPSQGLLNITSGGYNSPFTYTPTGNPGIHILRYIPRNAISEQGNITYIYVFVSPNYSTCVTNSCNLVTNGNFEDGINPTIESQITKACGWATPIPSTPDYFSTSSNPVFVGIPLNQFGYEPIGPSGGSKYAGMYFGYSNISPSYNEIIYTKLTSPLQPNTAYTLKFDVSLAENFASSSYSIQAYLSNNLSFISSSQSSIIVNNPSMLFTTSNTFTVSNGWQQGVINFTTNSTANEEYLVLGNLMNLSGVPVNQISYYYIDNISITTTTTLPTFNLPEGVCVNQTITLNNLVNPAGGVFSGTNVVNNSGNYTFGSNIPGNYNIAYTYTNSNGCVNSIIKQIMVGQNHSVTATNSSAVICTNFSQSTTTLTANSNTTGIVFTWQPGNIIGQQIVISPTSSTIYTVTGNNQGCISTATVAVNVQTACCTSTLPAFSGVAFPTYSTYLSPMVFNNSVELQSGSVVYLTNAEYLFAPNVKITVKKGARLHIEGAHLYACGNEMWDGIVVEDGGAIESYNGISTDCLIEDAYTAIHLQSQATTTLTGSGAIMNIDRTIFNKNFIGISINGYQKTETTYPFLIRNSVFTSRNFTYTPNSWPSTATTGFGLRVASTATNEFNAPYLLQNAAISNLKNPYNTQPSHKGIELISVGTTTGTTYFTIQIGRTVSTSDFNLFDNLGQAIEATNSNLRSLNNVFQNTQQYTVDPPGVPPPYTFGGNAIRHNITNEFNAQLNLTAASTNLSFGNRFYNCHYAINCDKVYFLDCQYATFRSTQSTTNTAFGQGNSGIVLRTNRFNYKVNNNHFANINNAVSILVSPSTYTYHPSGNGYGIYAAQLLLQNNYIGSQTTTAANITTQYVNNAISLQCTGGNTFQVATSNFAITTNTINRVYRGLEINGMSKINHPVNTGTNTIVLRDDNVFNVSQFAIKYTNNATGTIRSNTLSAVNTTNTLVTLFYAGGCTNNPTVACNNLSNSWQAFEYNGPNSNVFWRGNKMSTHARGLVLNNNGIIGTQGSSGNPSDNEWNNSWASSFGTYIGASSAAQNSPIWYRSSGGIYAPPTPFGIVSNGFWYGAPNTLFTTTGSYNCGGSQPPPPPSSNMVLNNSSLSMNSTNLSEEENYILQYANYNHVKNDVSLSSLNQSYISSNLNSSIGKMYQLNEMYYSGNLTSANSLNSTISPTNTVEQNYKTFYSLYSKFSIGNFTTADESSLELLSELCPGLYGTVIYQARALRNYIHKTVLNYKDMCEEQKLSARENYFTGVGEQKNTLLQVDLYPNPTNNFVTLVSTSDKEVLSINISDVNGKNLLSEKVITEKFTVQLNFNLQNGIYFVEIINDKNERTIKKLVISK